jgi:hypothetical protein
VLWPGGFIGGAARALSSEFGVANRCFRYSMSLMLCVGRGCNSRES